MEVEPKIENPYKPAPEDLSKMGPEQIRQKIEELKGELEQQKIKFEQNEKTIKQGIEANPRLKAELERIEEKKRKQLSAIDREQQKAKEEREKGISRMKQQITRIKPEHFNSRYMPRRLFFDPEFMRYVPGDKFMALMEDKELNDYEKELIVRARFKFCFDWLKNPIYLEYKKKKEEYESIFRKWLADPDSRVDEEGNPLDKNGNPLPKEPDFVSNPEIREMFRNDIRTLKELILINHYMPELFEEFDIVGHIRFGMIQDIRKSEAFAGRGREIRKVKVTDFYDIIEHVQAKGVFKGNSKEYYGLYGSEQLKALRKRMGRKDGPMDGKEPSEISGLGGEAWGSPVTMDLYDQSTLEGYKADRSDKRIIAKHLLIAFAFEEAARKKTGQEKVKIMSVKNKNALKWMRWERQGHRFYVIDDEFIAEIEREEGVTIPKEKLNKTYPFRAFDDDREDDDDED
jgi:hypothetical protein